MDDRGGRMPLSSFIPDLLLLLLLLLLLVGESLVKRMIDIN